MSNPVFGKVAVLGAGTMGAGIAQVCAAAGSAVVLQDVAQEVLDRAVGGIAAFLDKGIEKGKTTEQGKRATLDAIRTTLGVRDAVTAAELVIEAVPEDVELKQRLFEEVAAHAAADTVLASNTSSLSLADVFARVGQRDRCLGMHFFNPPPIMPLLELVRTGDTSAAVLDRVSEYAAQIGKEAIVVKDSPGFATSRLGVALGLEAIRMVEDGVAAPEDIDKAMVLGYRHPMGPLKLTDLVGLDVRMAIADYLAAKLSSPAFAVPALMRRMVERGELGKKAGKGFYDWR